MGPLTLLLRFQLVDTIDLFPLIYILLISLQILLGIDHAILCTFLLVIYRIHIYSFFISPDSSHYASVLRQGGSGFDTAVSRPILTS